MREKWACLAASHAAREAGHSLTFSHFPLWEKSGAKTSFPGTGLCHPGGELTLVKWNCSTYPLQCVLSQIFFFFFAPAVCWNFSAVFLDFCKGSVVPEWLSKSVMSRGSDTKAKRGWSWFTVPIRVHSQDRGMYASYLMHRWVRILLVPWCINLVTEPKPKWL